MFDSFVLVGLAIAFLAAWYKGIATVKDAVLVLLLVLIGALIIGPMPAPPEHSAEEHELCQWTNLPSVVDNLINGCLSSTHCPTYVSRRLLYVQQQETYSDNTRHAKLLTVAFIFIYYLW
jgi:hypothetical protein